MAIEHKCLPNGGRSQRSSDCTAGNIPCRPNTAPWFDLSAFRRTDTATSLPFPVRTGFVPARPGRLSICACPYSRRQWVVLYAAEIKHGWAPLRGLREFRYPYPTKIRLLRRASESRFPRRRIGAILFQLLAFSVLLWQAQHSCSLLREEFLPGSFSASNSSCSHGFRSAAAHESDVFTCSSLWFTLLPALSCAFLHRFSSSLGFLDHSYSSTMDKYRTIRGGCWDVGLLSGYSRNAHGCHSRSLLRSIGGRATLGRVLWGALCHAGW